MEKSCLSLSEIKQWNFPLIFFSSTLVVSVTAIALGAVAQEHDSNWNTKFENKWEGLMVSETNQTFTQEQIHTAYRDTWMKQAFLGIISCLIIATVIHILVYIFYKEEHYRYNASLGLAVIGILLYMGGGVFIMTSTAVNNEHYTEIHFLAVNKSVLDNSTILPLFYGCAYTTANEAGTVYGEEEVEDDVKKTREEIFKDGICQNSTIKFAAGALALFNMLLLAGVLLTTKSKISEEEREYQNMRDLDYDPYDKAWTEPLSTWRLGEPRRRHEIEGLVELHQANMKKGAAANGDAESSIQSDSESISDDDTNDTVSKDEADAKSMMDGINKMGR